MACKPNTPSTSLTSRPSSGGFTEKGLELKHGLIPDYQCRVNAHIKSIIFHPQDQSTVVHHTKGFAVYNRNGLEKTADSADLAKAIDRLLYEETHSVYVGVAKERLLLLDTDFQVVCECEVEGRILDAVVNTWTGEVVTGGPGNISSYLFKQGGKVLSLSLVITEGLSTEEEVSLVCVEEVPGKAQRCFSVIDTGVKVHLMASGQLLASRCGLHSRPITELLFFRPLCLLITAAKDGAIKVWSADWSLVCTFVGHNASVTSLTPHPTPPLIISASSDTTLRVWNLATHDQVEIVQHATPILGVSSIPGVSHVLSHSGRQLKGWKVQSLHTQHALTGPVTFLTHSTHPLVPLRVLAACADSAVRVVSPVSGEVITTALLDLGKTIVSLAYFAFKEVLYALDSDGLVSVYDTSTNPSSLLVSWSTPSTHSMGEITCLALYELASDNDDIEESLAADKWLGVTLAAREASHLTRHQRNPLDKHREGHSLLLAGTKRGHMVLLGQEGGVVSSARCPGNETITMIICNPRKGQVISTGQDGTLDVWRLYSQSLEPLSHVFSFSLAASIPPSALATTRDRLAVVTNHTDLASYSVDMFDLTEKVTYSSVAESSHSDTITFLSACLKLRIFATTSLDATLRVWSENNEPIRVLCLDCPPTGLTFSSQCGEITLAMHSHLHTVQSTTYVDETLHKSVLSLRLSEPVREVARDWSAPLHTLPVTDRARLQLIDNTISQEDYKGALSSEEMAVLEELARCKAFSLEALAAREEEIRAIRDGLLKATKKFGSRGPKKGKEKEAFWKDLLAVLLPGEPRLKLYIPEEDTFDPDGTPIRQPTPDAPFMKGPRLKFFPPLATFDPPYPVAPDGYLPNSILLKELRKSLADQALAEDWRPPEISVKQRKLLQEMKEESEDEEESEAHNDELLSRLRAAMNAAPPTPTPSPTPPPTPPPPSPPHKKDPTPRKPIVKLIAPKAPPPKPPTPSRTPTPPPPKSPTPPPTPPPPPTPLPEFIAQFIGQRWFDKLFPNANSKTFPKPWTVSKFVYSLLSALKQPTTDTNTKADICTALLKLVLQHSPRNQGDIYNTVLSLMTTPPFPSPNKPTEHHLVLASLKLLFQLSEFDSRMASLMISQFVLGDHELSRLVSNQFLSKGIIDPERYFERMLETVSVPSEGVEDVMSWGEEWLQEWAGNLAASRGPSLKGGSSKGSRVHAAGGGVSSRRRKTSIKSPPVTTFDPVEVINYYVKKEHEAELARNRVVTPPPPPPPSVAEDELPHNTVVALPKITRHGGLIRLGETHCSCCHPDRETSLALLHQLPPHYNCPHPHDPTKLWRHFTRSLTLALTPQNVNPFLTEEEREAERELMELSRTQRLSTGSVLKYFVPERSYVNSDT